ncbi:pilus assembly FimT family protein [Metaclostridioides mangenotii]|uniref:pilus assembly FimT family protein n=1 Tax=Metaclostridioides mangenotii TaxID=1540 RepID=UPI0026F1F398|nr:hypothetical protein [Clostridioides mangenotii]
MTVVELVVTISVIILISTLCIPKGSIDNRAINLFSRQFCSDIRFVRRENMLGNYNTYIYYTKKKCVEGYILRKDGEDIKTNLLPKDAKIDHSLSTIKFKIDGSPVEKGSTIEVYKKKYCRYITITPVSGRILLKEDKYES